VEIEMHGESAKSNFAALEKRRAEIEKACGVPLTWHNPQGKNTCRIYTRVNADFTQEHLWPQNQQWLKEKLELFQKVFSPIVQNLDVEEETQAAGAGA
jgi:hypothetical protein